MKQHVLCIVGSLLLAGLQWGCHPVAPGPAPTAEGQRQPPPPAPTPPPVQDAPAVTEQEREEMRATMGCYALGAFAQKVARERDEFGVTQEEALSHVAQLTMKQLQTTTSPDIVTTTGLLLSAMVRLVYHFPNWTPDEAALHGRDVCLEERAKARRSISNSL